jgi:hypothetical protein
VTVETLVDEIAEWTAGNGAPDEHDLAVRHELPVATVRTTVTNAVAAATFHTMPALYWCIVDNQRPRIDDGRDVAPLLRPSTPPSPAPVDGAAALVAGPDDPAGEGRDRPLGAQVTSPRGPRTDERGGS